MQYYSMDTQKIESGQNGQTDVQDDNRVIVKIRDLKENERYQVEGLFSGNSKYGDYFGLKLKDNKLAFVGAGTVGYRNIIDFFNLNDDYDFINQNKYGNGRLNKKNIQDVEMFVFHGVSKKTLKNYTVLNFEVIK